MKRRSKRHHEIPQWLLARFCVGETAQLWVGFKNSRDVRCLHISHVFVRKDGNTRTDFVATGGDRAKRVRSSRDEKTLADFDGRTSAAARSAITWGRAYRAKPQIATALAPAHVHILKQLIVGQARRTQESQDRIALTHSVDDTILDQLYLRAEASSTSLPSRSDLRSATEVQEWLADMRQNMRANFASGDHAILRVKESEFLSRSGLTVAVVPTSGPSFVIGSSGITISGSGTHEQAWLPVCTRRGDRAVAQAQRGRVPCRRQRLRRGAQSSSCRGER